MSKTKLYKAKRLDNEKWIYGGIAWLDSDKPRKWFITVTEDMGDDKKPFIQTHKVNFKTICQAIGLEDYIGNPLFENDNIQADNWLTSESGVQGVIKWSENGACWCIDEIPILYFNALEFIGNIHNNAN